MLHVDDEIDSYSDFETLKNRSEESVAVPHLDGEYSGSMGWNFGSVGPSSAHCGLKVPNK